jgi:hypothetical protein
MYGLTVKIRKDEHLSEGGINVWINNKECGYLDTSPRDFKEY